MCGRYRRTTQEEELARIYNIPIPPQLDLPISYNIAPSQNVLTIRYNPKTKQRSLDQLRWGLIPHWAKDQKIAYKTINARAETVDTARSYRLAFANRRCLIPADGFYEWRRVGAREPVAIEMKDGKPFVFAGLWENWKDRDSGLWLRSCTIITTEANELIGQIHDRMPVILPEEHHSRWLGENPGNAENAGNAKDLDETSSRPVLPAISSRAEHAGRATQPADLKQLLKPYPAAKMRMWEISRRVNSPKNDDPEVLNPLPTTLRLDN